MVYLSSSCPFCEEAFPTIVARRRHMRQTYGGRIAKFTCEECGKPFGKNSHMSQHVRNIHLKERQFTCNVCLKTFYRRAGYIQHMNKHVNGNFQCPACHHVFATHDKMSYHQLECTVADIQHSKNPNIQPQNSTDSDVQAYNHIVPEVQAYNPNSIGLEVQDYIGSDEATDSNSTCSEPDVSSVTRVSPAVMTGASGSSGGTYFIINHNQFQI